MTSLGVPGIDSLADAVSADERFVVGTLRNNSGRFRAFRWSESKGAEIIHEAPSLDTWAVDVSADGSVVIGISNDGTSRSFRWSKATGFHYWVPYRDGGSDYVSKTSEDGTISIGQCTFSNPLETKACVWRGTSRPVLIGDLGGRMSAATEMNSDGSVIVGWSQTSSGEYRAFRWTAASGVQSIGTLDNLPSQATCVSEDGNIIYGRLWKSDGSGLNRGFRWTASGGMTEFPSLGGNDVQPLATNRDGTVVVGIANDAMGRQRAFRYVAP
jgi:probable HAF family extracellular repeat protein